LSYLVAHAIPVLGLKLIRPFLDHLEELVVVLVMKRWITAQHDESDNPDRPDIYALAVDVNQNINH
jgi:hypothetical protein